MPKQIAVRETESHNNMIAHQSAPWIRVLPRLVAERREPLEKEVCISITNPKQSPAQLADFADVLRLGFHDTDRAGGRATLMSRPDAKAVLAFAHQYRNAPLTVHCEFGASRSVAVGLFLAAWLYRPLFVAATDVLIPNRWVVNQLRAAAAWRGFCPLDHRLLACAAFGNPDYLTKHIPSISHHD